MNEGLKYLNITSDGQRFTMRLSTLSGRFRRVTLDEKDVSKILCDLGKSLNGHIQAREPTHD